jgi:hypothetical protein
MQHGILASGVTLDALVEHVISQVGENGSCVVTYSWADGCQPTDMTDLNGTGA